MVVAVLSLQGAVIEHIQMLDKLGVGTFEIRKKADLYKHFDGLIIPGGESTVQGKLLHELDIYDTLKENATILIEWADKFNIEKYIKKYNIISFKIEDNNIRAVTIK